MILTAAFHMLSIGEVFNPPPGRYCHRSFMINGGTKPLSKPLSCLFLRVFCRKASLYLLKLLSLLQALGLISHAQNSFCDFPAPFSCWFRASSAPERSVQKLKSGFLKS